MSNNNGSGDLQSKYDFNSAWAECIAILIIVGLGVEIAAVFILKKPFFWEGVLTIVANALIVAGVWGELWFSRRAKKAGDGIVAEAKERTAKLEKEAATARLQASQLQALLSPRRINEDVFLSELSDKPSGIVEVMCLPHDGEAWQLSFQLVELLDRSGWKANGPLFIPAPYRDDLIPPQMIMGGQPTGIVVFARNRDSDEFVGLLVAALQHSLSAGDVSSGMGVADTFSPPAGEVWGRSHKPRPRYIPPSVQLPTCHATIGIREIYPFCQLADNRLLFGLEDNKVNIVGRPPAGNWVEFHARRGVYDVKVERDERSVVNPKPRKTYRFQMQGPNAWQILEKVNGKKIPDIKFFNMGEITIAGRTVRALRHGMSGAPGLEIWGPSEDAPQIKAALVEAGKEFGLRQGGARAYSTVAIESAWIPSPMPAIYGGEKMKPYREWLRADSFEANASLGGSFVSKNIEDYYLTPWDLGYGPM